MFYCGSFYNSIHLDVNDQVSPCCFYYPKPQATSNVLTFYRDNFQIDRQSLDWPAGCKYCQVSETQSSRSPRTEFTGRVRSWGTPDSTENIQSLSLFLGNKCNLHCATCDSKYSTGWIKIADHFGVNQSLSVSIDLNKIDELLPALGDLRELSIMGGEPVYMNELDAVIDRLDIDLSNCVLRISTNGTIRPSLDKIERWRRFKEINVAFSIDGVGPSFEYLRHPGQWNDLVENIAHYRTLPIKTRLSMFSTVSMANVYDIDQLAEWGVKNFGLGVNFNAAQKDIWELCNLPPKLKQAWLDKYNTVSYAHILKPFIEQDCQSLTGWQGFRDFCDQWDSKWNLDFAETFPEWSRIIKEHNLW
jgi:hypothetical protein